MNAALLGQLWDATLALSVAIIAVLLLRRVLRRGLGAELAYAAWIAPPLAAFAVLLPPLTAVPTVASPLPSLPTVASLAIGDAASAVPAGSIAALVVWLVGAALTAVAFARQQRRFVRRLALAPAERDGARVPLVRAHGVGAGPAMIGALRPQIVLPVDFETRYDATERELVLAHEHAHVARRDGLANAALAALRCLFWFNPLVHYGARRFRFDQELACDAAVLRRHPHARRAYAEAILKTQLAVPGLPVGCHWQSSQPLKERILMLSKDRATRTRTGTAAIALLVGLVAFSCYAAQSRDAAPADGTKATDVDPSYAALKRVSYPQAAIDAKLEGDVVVRVHIGDDGHVVAAMPDAESPQPAQVLQDAAVDAVRTWRFNPAQRNGWVVDTWVNITVSFRLDESEAPPGSDGFDVIQVKPEPAKQ